jgi:hypothetical protein
VTPMQIEGMIDRICGLFPTTQIGRNTVKNAWVVDDFLLAADLEDSRKALDWIKLNSEKFPSSLREMHNIIRKVQGKHEIKSEISCDVCDGTLWDNGVRYSGGDNPQQITQQPTTMFMGRQYKVVHPCPNCRGKDWRPPDTN